jgi:succinate-semialdehyde dehydrogenase / glutarate-semialdehyde dehydrogenase
MFQTKNPATGEVLESFPQLSSDQIDYRMHQATEAFAKWKRLSVAERADQVRSLADLLDERIEQCANTITLEMGKPIDQAVSEIEKCAWLCRYYADRAAEFLSEKTIDAGYEKSYVRYDPTGAVLGVMPWNFPFWQAFRYAVPALLAGNVALLKPAPNVPRCGLMIEALMSEAIQVPVAFQTLFLDTNQVESVIAHPVVQGVALTGSDRAGSAVASLAGKYLKKCVMELGGSDAYIILEDANLAEAVKTGVTSRMLNTGQTCIAAKRFIVHEKVYDKVMELFSKEIAALKTGDPAQNGHDLGPMARPDLLENLNRQLTESVAGGATINHEGGPRKGDGNYFDPVLLTDIQPETPAYQEELFGPVLPVFKVASEAEAVELANDTTYGLGAAVWSKNKQRAERVAGELEAGAIAINGMVKSDPNLPFGGVKRSGFGRELGREGMLEFVNVKTVVVF